MRLTPFMILWLFVFSGGLAIAAEGPIDPNVSIKVMGRGIEDRKTGEKLQFACVEQSLELDRLRLSSIPLDPECPEVRPLYQNARGELFYLDARYPIFAPDPAAQGRDRRFQKRIQKGLEQTILLDIERVQNLRKETGIAASKKRLFKTGFMKTVGDAALPLSGFGTYMFGMPLLEGATLVINEAAWVFAGVMAAPTVLFAIPVAFHIISQIVSSPGKVFTKNSLGDLEDFEARDRSYWQFKANKINDGLFRSVFRVFSNDDSAVAIDDHPKLAVIREIQLSEEDAQILEFDFLRGSYPILKEGKNKKNQGLKLEALYRMQGDFSRASLAKGMGILKQHVRQRAWYQPQNTEGDVLKVSFFYTYATWGCRKLRLERLDTQGTLLFQREKEICKHEWKQLPKTLERFMDEALIAQGLKNSF